MDHSVSNESLWRGSCGADTERFDYRRIFKLLEEFKARRMKVRPAVEEMIEAAKAVVWGAGDYFTYNDIFGSKE